MLKILTACGQETPTFRTKDQIGQKAYCIHCSQWEEVKEVYNIDLCEEKAEEDEDTISAYVPTRRKK